MSHTLDAAPTIDATPAEAGATAPAAEPDERVGDEPPTVSPEPARDAYRPGTRVEVRRRFDDRWAKGFEVAEVVDAGYRLLRLSDKSVIPSTFCDEDVRKERKQSTWWY